LLTMKRWGLTIVTSCFFKHVPFWTNLVLYSLMSQYTKWFKALAAVVNKELLVNLVLL